MFYCVRLKYDSKVYDFITAAPSGFPANFTAISVTSRTISLAWEPPPLDKQNGVIIRYVINVTYTLHNTREMFQLFPTTNTTLVYSLIPYTAYTCVIAAETAVGVGPFSAAYMVMTSADGEIVTLNPSSL